MNSHIVIVNDYGFINGGAGKIAIFTATGLASQGEDVTFFCSVGPVCDELKNSKCKIICLFQQDINNKSSKLKVLTEGIDNKVAKKSFKALIDLFGNDPVIVHIHSWNKAISSSPFRYLKKKANVKAVVTLHDYFSVCPNGGLYDYKHKHICHIMNDTKCFFCNCDKRNYCQKIFRFFRYKRQQQDMKSIHNFIYLSELNKKVFLEKYKRKANMFYVQNFIEPAKEKVPHPESNEYFLYIGRISEEKGVDDLCKALTETNNKGFIIGDGPLYKELKEKYPNLVFTGWLSHAQMVPYIMKSKAFVFPSKWYEGSPLVVPEMLSYGLPCIVSDCSSAKEEINKTTSLVFSNFVELCLALNRITPKADFVSYAKPQDYIQTCLRTYRIIK
jgi:glycosyltransferase involved in cell wall biosynthesis